MANVNWTYNDVMANAKGTFYGVSELSLRLIATSALAYVTGVYWYGEDKANKRTAKEVREEIMSLCETDGYKKGAQYDYADLSWRLAADMVKSFGTGAGKDVNPFWQIIQACEDVDEAAAFIVSHIKGTLHCNTVLALRQYLSPEKAAKDKLGFAESVLKRARKGLEEGEIMPEEIHVLIAGLMDLAPIMASEAEDIRAAA